MKARRNFIKAAAATGAGVLFFPLVTKAQIAGANVPSIMLLLNSGQFVVNAAASASATISVPRATL